MTALHSLHTMRPLAVALTLALLAAPQAPPPAGKPPALGQNASADLAQAFAAQGIHLDLEHGLCAFPASVLVREDLLEYLLVNPRGRRTRARSSPTSCPRSSTSRCSRWG